MLEQEVDSIDVWIPSNSMAKVRNSFHKHGKSPQQVPRARKPSRKSPATILQLSRNSPATVRNMPASANIGFIS
jgi:hypothetical protein